MASSTKITNTLNVELQDSNLSVTTLKFDNPRGTATRAGVESAFAYLMGGASSQSGRRILYSKANVPFTTIGAIQYVTTVIEKEDLE